MKTTIKLINCLLSIGIGCFLIAGCRNQVFGVDEKVWNTLSENEKRQVIDGYNKEKEEREKNAIVHETADTARHLIFWNS